MPLDPNQATQIVQTAECLIKVVNHFHEIRMSQIDDDVSLFLESNHQMYDLLAPTYNSSSGYKTCDWIHSQYGRQRALVALENEPQLLRENGCFEVNDGEK